MREREHFSMLCVPVVPAAAARLGRFLPDLGRLCEQRGPSFLNF